MRRSRIASLVPGRVLGRLQTDPAHSAVDDILLLDQRQLAALHRPPAGLLLVEAAPFSHTIIQWLGRGVPMALIDADQARRWRTGDRVMLDAAAGELRGLPSAAEPVAWPAPVATPAGRPVYTADGVAIRLSASVSDVGGVGRAVQAGASAIGLVRTEYLLPRDRRAPDEAFYADCFAEMSTRAEGLEVDLRLLDLAADKRPGWLGHSAVEQAGRGLHGSQLFGDRVVRQVVDAQLAALARLRADRNMGLIWPSGGALAEFLAWRERLASRAPAIGTVGAMVESPIEMLAIHHWLAAADRVSVGCNDLLQHLCAADRDDPRQRRLLDPYRPELWRFLRDAAIRAGDALGRVRLCGLLAQIEGLIGVLIGLGYRDFSAEPALIPLLRRAVSGSRAIDCGGLADALCAAADSTQVRARLGVAGDRPWGLINESVADGPPVG